MTTIASNIEIASATEGFSPMPVAMLQMLATRFRSGGVMLTMHRADGSVAWADASAGLFLQRYAGPILETPDVSELISTAFNNGQETGTFNSVPGLTLTAVDWCDLSFPCFKLVLSAKSTNFKLSEEVIRACGKSGIDALWLNQQAEQLPGFDEAAMQRQGTLLLSMLRDQQRLHAMESEIGDLSGKLAGIQEELSLIHQVNGGMKVNLSTREFFRQACNTTINAMGVRAVGVGLAGDSRQEPIICGGETSPEQIDAFRLSDEIIEALKQIQSPLIVHNLAIDLQFDWLAPNAKQLLAVPVMRQEQVLGCLFALDKKDGPFADSDCHLLASIANEAAVYLENAMLFADARGLMMGLLHSLTSAVDAKDAYTCGHSERVAEFARYLARQACLTEAQVERIYMAGLLHDVGKIGVPEAVLQKAGRLTTQEFEQMKKHPTIGAKILRNIRQVEDMIPGVLHHHERYDGKGYPAGLCGEEIPLMGRIICLADCFDAMTSNRTYRKALPLEVALLEIQRCSGTQFDPKLTDAFLSLGVAPFRQIVEASEIRARTVGEPEALCNAA